MSHPSVTKWRVFAFAATLLLVSPGFGAPKRGSRAPLPPTPATASPVAPVPAPVALPEVVEKAPAVPVAQACVPVAAQLPAAGDTQHEALGAGEAARLAEGRTGVRVYAGVALAGHSFAYSDPIGSQLAPYALGAAPMLTFELESYPAASANLPFLSDLGLRGGVDRAFALSSVTPDGTSISTNWTRFEGELRERLRVRSAHPLELGVFAGANANYFELTANRPVAALLPGARTVALRFGGDARVLVAWRLSAMASFAYLVPLEQGEIYSRFRDPSLGGVDARVGLCVALAGGLEAHASVRYTRYFSTFRPVLGDTNIAGGALDEVQQFGLGVSYAH